MEYICDNQRHLICKPYTPENLHKMAEDLGIKRCWYHARPYPHYDIPKKRIAEVQAKCTVVSPKLIINTIKASGEYTGIYII